MIICGINSQGAVWASVVLSLKKGRRPWGGPCAAVLPGLMFFTGLGIDTSEISALVIGMRRSEHEPSRERSRNVWKPAALLGPALWSSTRSSLCLPWAFCVLPEHLSAEVMFPSPAPGRWSTVGKKHAKSVKVSRHSWSFQVSAVSSLPCPQTERSIGHPREAWIQWHTT